MGAGRRRLKYVREKEEPGTIFRFLLWVSGRISETFYLENETRERSQLAGKLTYVSVNFLRLRPLGRLGRNFWKEVAFPELEIWVGMGIYELAHGW